MKSSSPIRSVIFDCDGVLVDSEEIANRALAGLLTEAGSAEAFAQAIRRWLAMPLGTRGVQARLTIEQGYSLRAVAERYVKLYGEVVEERRQGSA